AEPKPTAPSNIAKVIGFTKGDVEAGFRDADVVIERRYSTQPVHQAYIEPHACVVSVAADGQCTIWSSSQGQFMVRAYCAKLLGIDISQIRAIPAEIGGGFGGKTLIYLEPLALAMSRITGRPVKMGMSLDELADQLGIDPLALREKNAAKDGVKALHGPTWQNIGYAATVEAAKNHPHLKEPLGPNQGRGVASGFWFNIGGESSAACHINEDGTAVVAVGTPDIGGSRASMAMMAAEILGIPVERVRPIVADTSSIGFSFLTGGSRVTFATGMATTQAAEKVVEELKKRAAMIWDIPADAVEWKDGKAYPAGPNAGSFEPLPLAEIALKSGRTGG